MIGLGGAAGRLVRVGCVLAGLSGVCAAGQDEPLMTLHAYTNTVQVPVLVLSPLRERVKPIDGKRFGVSLDAGPVFRATHVRLEGDDPISLAIVVDLRGPAAELMPWLETAVAALADGPLQGRDRVSVYAIDCELVRTLNDVPAEARRLKRGMEDALRPWRERRRAGGEPSCKQTVPLWDALAYVSSQLYKLPGRRVVLAVSNGHDEGSRNSWNMVKTWAQSWGVAVFGMKFVGDAEWKGRTRVRLKDQVEDPFNALCELSGGMVLTASPRTAAQGLDSFVELVRGRYIVEFPLPLHPTGGPHGMDVTVAGMSAFIRSAGVSAPLPDPKVLADPTTLPADPTNKPVMGSRKILTPP